MRFGTRNGLNLTPMAHVSSKCPRSNALGRSPLTVDWDGSNSPESREVTSEDGPSKHRWRGSGSGRSGGSPPLPMRSAFWALLEDMGVSPWKRAQCLTCFILFSKFATCNWELRKFPGLNTQRIVHLDCPASKQRLPRPHANSLGWFHWLLRHSRLSRMPGRLFLGAFAASQRRRAHLRPVVPVQAGQSAGDKGSVKRIRPFAIPLSRVLNHFGAMCTTTMPWVVLQQNASIQDQTRLALRKPEGRLCEGQHAWHRSCKWQEARWDRVVKKTAGQASCIMWVCSASKPSCKCVLCIYQSPPKQKSTNSVNHQLAPIPKSSALIQQFCNVCFSLPYTCFRSSKPELLCHWTTQLPSHRSTVYV